MESKIHFAGRCSSQFQLHIVVIEFCYHSQSVSRSYLNPQGSSFRWALWSPSFQALGHGRLSGARQDQSCRRAGQGFFQVQEVTLPGESQAQVSIDLEMSMMLTLNMDKADVFLWRGALSSVASSLSWTCTSFGCHTAHCLACSTASRYLFYCLGEHCCLLLALGFSRLCVRIACHQVHVPELAGHCPQWVCERCLRRTASSSPQDCDQEVCHGWKQQEEQSVLCSWPEAGHVWPTLRQKVQDSLLGLTISQSWQMFYFAAPRTKGSKELVVIIFVSDAKLLVMNEFVTSCPQHLLTIGHKLIPFACDVRPPDAPEHLLLAQFGAGRVEGWSQQTEWWLIRLTGLSPEISGDGPVWGASFGFNHDGSSVLCESF